MRQKVEPYQIGHTLNRCLSTHTPYMNRSFFGLFIDIYGHTIGRKKVKKVSHNAQDCQ